MAQRQYETTSTGQRKVVNELPAAAQEPVLVPQQPGLASVAALERLRRMQLQSAEPEPEASEMGVEMPAMRLPMEHVQPNQRLMLEMLRKVVRGQ